MIFGYPTSLVVSFTSSSGCHRTRASSPGQRSFTLEAQQPHEPESRGSSRAPKVGYHLEGDQFGWLLTQNRLSVQCALFRRSSISTSRWFDPCAKANEDWEFAVRLSRMTRIYEDTEPVVLGFVSDDSISTRRGKQTLGLLRILRRNREFLKSYPRQHAALILDLARTLHKSGKTRHALRFVGKAISLHPVALPMLAWATVRRQFALMRRVGHRMGFI